MAQKFGSFHQRLVTFKFSYYCENLKHHYNTPTRMCTLAKKLFVFNFSSLISSSLLSPIFFHVFHEIFYIFRLMDFYMLVTILFGVEEVNPKIKKMPTTLIATTHIKMKSKPTTLIKSLEIEWKNPWWRRKLHHCLQQHHYMRQNVYESKKNQFW